MSCREFTRLQRGLWSVESLLRAGAPSSANRVIHQTLNNSTDLYFRDYIIVAVLSLAAGVAGVVQVDSGRRFLTINNISAMLHGSADAYCAAARIMCQKLLSQETVGSSPSPNCLKLINFSSLTTTTDNA